MPDVVLNIILLIASHFGHASANSHTQMTNPLFSQPGDNIHWQQGQPQE
jgi:hypothetical protein